MKTQAWVYVAVVVLSLGAGVAIAGTPGSVPPDPPIQALASAAGREGSVPSTTSSVVGEAGEPRGDDALVPSNPDDDPSATSSTAASTSTTTTSTSTTTTTTTTTLPPPPRAEISLAVVNGAEVGGSATRSANALAELGYVDIDTFDGDEIVDITVVYAVEGFQSAADRLVDEIGLGPDLVFPLVTAPPLDGLGDEAVVLYLGRDIVELPWFVN